MSESYHIEDEVDQRAYDGRLMRRLTGYVRPYKMAMGSAVFLLLLAALLSNVGPLLIMWSVDTYINNEARTALQQQTERGEALSPSQEQLFQQLSEENLHGLGILILFLGLMIVGEALIRYVQLLLVALVGQRTMLVMRLQIFRHLQEMSLRFLDENPVGRLMSRVTSDVEKIQQTIVTGVVQVLSDLMTIIVVLIFMFSINWRLALIAISPVPFIFLSSVVFRHYTRRSFLGVRKKIARLSAYLQENISGMRIVQLFGREADHYEAYRERNADHRDEWIQQIRNFALYFPVVDFLSTFSTALIILYCGDRMLNMGEHLSGVASVGTFFGFIFWAEKFFGPIRALADRYNLLLEAMASSERVFQLLDSPEEIKNSKEAHIPEGLEGHIVFDSVSFAYTPPQWIVKNIDFTVRPGERVAIVGHTGAGKSTLINLLSRFYDVQEGSILVDGRDIRHYDKVALRRRIGIVLQDVFLFSGSIEENIRLGDEEMTREHLEACADYVNAAAFINKLPGGYDYHVGERGCNLSTGQRQLLAFARTLAHGPDILVLDEATSSIDTETEALIQDAIAKLLKGRSSIVIAHRLSTIQHADRILVMHHGEIRESGTHQELLAMNGLYRRLYELQYKA